MNPIRSNSFRNLKLLLIIQLSIFTMFAGPESGAQKAAYRKYSVLDGLPQSQVRNIFQDSRGYIWIPTHNGLSRFDGIEFVNYFRSDGLPDNQVLSIFEDNDKKLWALTWSGLAAYNGKGFDYFEPPADIRHHLFDIQPSVDSSNNIFIVKDTGQGRYGRIVIFEEGLYSDYSSAYAALDTFSVIDLLIDKTGAMLLQNRDHTAWLWKNQSLSRLNPRKYTTLFRENDNLMAESKDTLFRFNGRNFVPFNPELNDAGFRVLKSPSGQDVSLQVLSGCKKYRIDLPFHFSAYWSDRENVLWFSSEGNMYRLLPFAFSCFYEEDIGKTNIWAIAEDRNGHIFFGSLYNSLVEFDGTSFRERNEFKSLFRKNISFYKGSRKMSNGDIWFSTNTGVLIWDGKAFSVLKGIPENTQVCYIYEDTVSRTVMIGTDRGLYIRKNEGMELNGHFTDSGLGVIEGIARDDSGFYWMSGHKGIVKFDGSHQVAVTENKLPDEFTYTIERDNMGGIWVTSEEGLYFRKKGSDHFIPGLPEQVNTPANSIMIMDAGHLLVGRVNDICVIDLNKLYTGGKNYFRIYDSSDGFPGSDCLDDGIIRDISGRFWILTSDKAVIFDPGNLSMDNNPPKLNITGIQYETDSLTWEPVSSSGFFYSIPANVRLMSQHTKIMISFNGISTPNPEKVRMQYRLQGYDDNWSLPSGKRFVIYEKLPPGHYTFDLKGSNADGVETLQPLTVPITIVPAFTERIIFRVILYLAGMALVILLTLRMIRRRHARQQEEARLRHELSQLQLNSVLRQFDPHFTFNVISAIGSLIMRGEKENAYDYITILGKLLRTVLAEGSVIVRPLSDEIDFVNKYCELQKLRFRDRINFSLTIDPDAILQRTIPKMTIQLFVENAIKHGFENRTRDCRVDVAILKGTHWLEIVITDNGIGRAAAATRITNGTGTGLKMITGLFEVSNSYNNTDSTIEIIDLQEDGIAAGTRIKIIIPDDYRFDSGN